MSYELFGFLNYFLLANLVLLLLSIYNERYEKLFVFSTLLTFLYLVLVQILFWRDVYVSFGGHVIRYYPPFWIENEKLFFWFFLSTLLLLKVEERRVSKFLLLFMLISVILFQNPSDPLPNLKRELENFHPAFFQFYLARATYFYNSPYMWVHPPILFAAYAFLLHSFALTISKKNEYEFAKHGYVFLTLGLISGYPWAVEAWGKNWWWDPKISMSIMLWIVYTAYLHARVSGRYFRELNVLGFVSLVATYITTYVLPGVHGYG